MANLISGCFVFICSPGCERNSWDVCCCEGFGPIGLIEGIWGKQGLAEPSFVNPSPINPKNRVSDKTCALFSADYVLPYAILLGKMNSPPFRLHSLKMQ